MDVGGRRRPVVGHHQVVADVGVRVGAHRPGLCHRQVGAIGGVVEVVAAAVEAADGHHRGRGLGSQQEPGRDDLLDGIGSGSEVAEAVAAVH